MQLNTKREKYGIALWLISQPQLTESFMPDRRSKEFVNAGLGNPEAKQRAVSGLNAGDCRPSMLAVAMFLPATYAHPRCARLYGSRGRSCADLLQSILSFIYRS